MRAFERQEGETAKSFAAFKVYRDLGLQRSLRRTAELVYGEGTKSVRRIEKWSSQHDWYSRARAWDDYHEMLRREAVAEYEREQGVDLAYRSAKLQEEVLASKEALLQRIEQMLEWPIEHRVTERDEGGKEVTHVYPAKWTYTTIVRALQILDDSPDKVDLRHIDFNALTDEQLERIANGEDPLRVIREGRKEDG